MKFGSLFNISKPIVGVVHLLPLPGSPKYQGHLDAIVDRSLKEVQLLDQGGVHGIIIENFNDDPFSTIEISKQQLGLMAAILTLARREVNIPIGVNVHFNDWEAEIALAFSCRAQFVRIEVFVDTVVTTSGIVQPCCAEVTRFRKSLGVTDQISILADIHPKYSKNLLPTSLKESALMAQNAMADAIIVTGESTGIETPLEDIRGVKEVIDLPVLAGSGITAENVNETLAIADGVIVGSAFKVNGNVHNDVSLDRIKQFMNAVKR